MSNKNKNPDPIHSKQVDNFGLFLAFVNSLNFCFSSSASAASIFFPSKVWKKTNICKNVIVRRTKIAFEPTFPISNLSYTEQANGIFRIYTMSI